MDYATSVKLALHRGYEEIQDPEAYKGRYFIKNNKKWIHDIDALMHHLGIFSHIDLENIGYDVQNYHNDKYLSNDDAIKEMQSLYSDITHCDGEATYLSDGMWLLPDGTFEHR